MDPVVSTGATGLVAHRNAGTPPTSHFPAPAATLSPACISPFRAGNGARIDAGKPQVSCEWVPPSEQATGSLQSCDRQALNIRSSLFFFLPAVLVCVYVCAHVFLLGLVSV